MSLRLGIGVVTYNRRELLLQTLAAVAQHTRSAHDLVVADDGSDDGTAAALAAAGIAFVTGRNMGVAWNKNRALFHLFAIRACDVVILLEDDMAPAGGGWEAMWVGAVERWGHVNQGGRGQIRTIAGAGTLDDPWQCLEIQARCAGFNREAINFVGYMDTRFRRFGHEHVEHSRRLLRAGYGGRMLVHDGRPRAIWYGLTGAFRHLPSQSYWTDAAVDANGTVLRQIAAEPVYRHAWRSDEEMRQFRDELRHGWDPGYAHELTQMFPPAPDDHHQPP